MPKKVRRKNRMVFSTSLTKKFVDDILLPERVENILISYWYLKDNPKEKLKLQFASLKKTTQQLFIDSGVFSFYRIFKVPGKGLSSNSPEMKQTRISVLKRFPEMLEYTRKYVKFLNYYDDWVDWAFDMDIDIFSSRKAADKLCQYMLENLKSPKKIIRIWHWTRSFDEWKEWCDSGLYKYLALENPKSHKHNISFYRRFIDYAHQRNIKVHVLATTSPEFLKHVDCDSADATTWVSGGRFGYCDTPFGQIDFGTGMAGNHWEKQNPTIQENLAKWLKEQKLPNTDTLKKDWQARNRVSVRYLHNMGYEPVDRESNAIRHRSFLDG